jgi:hypothetical protein
MTQANDLASKMPEKLAQMKELFTMEFARNKGFPVGGGLCIPSYVLICGFRPRIRSGLSRET